MIDWTARAVTADEAVEIIKPGMRLFVHGAAATPTPLLEALVGRPDATDITLYHLHTAGPAPFAEPEHRSRFFSVSVFTGPLLRRAIEEGAADFVPIFLSDIPALFLSRKVPLDVALLQLSPPDAHGYCTLGTSVDAALAASLSARHIVAEINERMPRTLGNTLVPLVRVHAFTRTDRPLHEHRSESQLTPRWRSISRARSWRIRSGSAFTRASAGRWISSEARRSRSEGNRSSRCRRPPQAARRRASSCP